MEPLFRYIWRSSRREQTLILLLVVASFPFYFASLDLPRTIINDAIQGGAFLPGHDSTTAFRLVAPALPWTGSPPFVIYDGLPLGRTGYLLALSAIFLALVLVNGAFKFVINLRKGALGEKLLQKLRLDLFNTLLRTRPEAGRRIKPSEVASVIRDEVEPIGGFVGDAFIQPVLLGGQAATAMAFILIQNIPLGLIAGVIVLVQFALIPNLRREQVRLGKLRQERSRDLAGRIGEAAGSLPEIRNHGAAPYESGRIETRLNELFAIRYDLFRRKFAVKFLNNLLAQLTPFIFYSIGGYYVLNGWLSVGQLVAVIVAYRELPPPIKELIDWDQQRVEVKVRYQQIIDQFAIGREAAPSAVSEKMPDALTGVIDCQGLSVVGDAGDKLLDRVDAKIPLGRHIALLSSSGDGAAIVAQVLGRRITRYDGEILIAGLALSAISDSDLSARVAYFGQDLVVFDASVRDNILYGLPDARGLDPAGDDAEDHRDQLIRKVASIVGLENDIFAFGFGRRVDPAGKRQITDRIVSARRAIKLALENTDGPRLIEPFDVSAYNRHSTVFENLIFGELFHRGKIDGMFRNLELLALLDNRGLTPLLVDMGRRIAATLVEMFLDVDPDSILLRRFSFLSASQIAFYRDLLLKGDVSGESIRREERAHFISLAFHYSEARHRLGLLSSGLEAEIVAARKTIAENAVRFSVEPFDPDRFCGNATIKDNLLFGRIVHEVPGAEAKVTSVLRRFCADSGLDRAMFSLGLDHEAGYGGCMLFAGQRAAIALARCLIRKPDILVLNDADGMVGDDRRATLERVRLWLDGQTVILATRDEGIAQFFDTVVYIDDKQARPRTPAGTQAASARDPRDQASTEIRALAALPIFADLNVAHLKLLAFTSVRLDFPAGATLIRQGEVADAAYVVLDGQAEVVWEGPSGRARVNVVGKNTLIGELGIVSGEPRSATIVALTDVSTLRLSAEVLYGLISEFPQIALAIMRDQIRRIVLTQDRLMATPDTGSEVKVSRAAH